MCYVTLNLTKTIMEKFKVAGPGEYKNGSILAKYMVCCAYWNEK